MNEKTALKSIFEYDNYRHFLRDYYTYWKAQDKKFSYRYFANRGGFKSGNILKIVIDGEINIIDGTIEKFCKALKLNKEESFFFKNLVMLNQATTSEDRAKYAKELLRSRTYKRIHPLSEYQYRYFDLWYFPVVRGLVALENFKENPQWIAQQLQPSITPAEAQKAIDELLILGLLSRSDTGTLIQSNPTVTSSDSIVSSSLANYHRQLLDRAKESIDRFSRTQRDLSVMTIAVSEESFKLIKELSEKFRRDVIEIAERDSHPDSVYQLSTYLFPTTLKK